MVDVSCCVTSNHIIQLSFTVSLVMSCLHCKKTFTKTSSLTRHLREKHEGNTTRIQCDLCQTSFVRPEHYRRHVHVVHKQAFKSQTSPCQVIKSKPFNFPMHLQPNSEKKHKHGPTHKPSTPNANGADDLRLWVWSTWPQRTYGTGLVRLRTVCVVDALFQQYFKLGSLLHNVAFVTLSYVLAWL